MRLPLIALSEPASLVFTGLGLIISARLFRAAGQRRMTLPHARTAPVMLIMRACLVLVAAVLAVSCARDPETAKRAYLASGDAYMSKQKYAEASIEYQNAIQQDDHFGEARQVYAPTPRDVQRKHCYEAATSYTTLSEVGAGKAWHSCRGNAPSPDRGGMIASLSASADDRNPTERDSRGAAEKPGALHLPGPETVGELPAWPRQNLLQPFAAKFVALYSGGARHGRPRSDHGQARCGSTRKTSDGGGERRGHPSSHADLRCRA